MNARFVAHTLLALVLAAPAMAGKPKKVAGASAPVPTSCEKEQAAHERCDESAGTVLERCEFACMKKYQYRFGQADRISAAQCSQSCQDRYESACVKPSQALERCKDAVAAAAELAACAERWGEGTTRESCVEKDAEAAREKAAEDERKRAATVHCGRFRVPTLEAGPLSGSILDVKTKVAFTRTTGPLATHADAMATCAKMGLRLPTQRELEALGSCQAALPPGRGDGKVWAFPFLWTSTPVPPSDPDSDPLVVQCDLTPDPDAPPVCGAADPSRPACAFLCAGPAARLVGKAAE